MEVISPPKTEEEILAVVSENANSEMVKEELVKKGEYCVDHLCGCK
jgi:hypothetical protein